MRGPSIVEAGGGREAAPRAATAPRGTSGLSRRRAIRRQVVQEPGPALEVPVAVLHGSIPLVADAHPRAIGRQLLERGGDDGLVGLHVLAGPRVPVLAFEADRVDEAVGQRDLAKPSDL